MTATRTTSLRRGLALLDALAEAAASPVGVSDLGRTTGQDKSQVSRTLDALADAGLVEREPGTGRARLGPRLFGLAARTGDARLRALAEPVLVRITAATGERSHVSVRVGAEVLTVASEASPRSLQAPGWVGRRVPVWTTSAGRALLLALGASELDALLSSIEDGSDRTDGPGAPARVDPEELAARLGAARRRGWVTVAGGFDPDLTGVAAPVRDTAGAIVAALNVSGPRQRLRGHHTAVGRAVAAAASELGTRLGGWPTGPLTTDR